ncbi:MAG: tyrosine-protein kinase family protein [Dechloromonas sp.]|jgi:exopolysaccharide/PEP-CTERM locus tyrosine autokinase|nr:MAG: tyrosine-protein kinase family protein [Dechloromonas sp.]
MSLIEQAAKRLEQLRQAGVELPEDRNPEFPPASPARDSAAAPQRQQKTPHLAASSSGDSRLAAHSDAASSPGKRVELDLEAIAASGLLVPSQTRTLLASEFRVIKRPLIANAMNKGASPIDNGNLIMVTSALPGEGKSFTAINLAVSIAMELDNTVMLVDADVARPTVLSMLGLPPAEGLLDVVTANSLDISGVLLRTNIEKLSILPSGTQHAQATELLASDVMVRLLDDMAQRYPDRIIIFDSPPLLSTTEARTLATHMGQIVVVVQAGETAQAAVKEALSTIEACPLKMMVLNQATQPATERYGYGYAYGYGYGNED